jgi:hypothetical protein
MVKAEDLKVGMKVVIIGTVEEKLPHSQLVVSTGASETTAEISASDILEIYEPDKMMVATHVKYPPDTRIVLTEKDYGFYLGYVEKLAKVEFGKDGLYTSFYNLRLDNGNTIHGVKESDFRSIEEHIEVLKKNANN